MLSRDATRFSILTFYAAELSGMLLPLHRLTMRGN